MRKGYNMFQSQMCLEETSFIISSVVNNSNCSGVRLFFCYFKMLYWEGFWTFLYVKIARNDGWLEWAFLFDAVVDVICVTRILRGSVAASGNRRFGWIWKKDIIKINYISRNFFYIYTVEKNPFSYAWEFQVFLQKLDIRWVTKVKWIYITAVNK